MSSEDNKGLIDVDVIYDNDSEIEVEIKVKSEKISMIMKVISAIKTAFKAILNAIKKRK